MHAFFSDFRICLINCIFLVYNLYSVKCVTSILIDISENIK